MESKPIHNHTPWPTYERTLSTHGYKIKHVREIMEGLKHSWLCPACKAALNKEVK